VVDDLQTERLSLRSITLDDADLLVALDSDPEVMRFLTGRPSTRDEVQETIRQHLRCRWVAHHTDTGEFGGWFGLVPGDEATLDVGYRLRPQWWGHGLATEGTRALIEAAFATLGEWKCQAGMAPPRCSDLAPPEANRRSRPGRPRATSQLPITDVDDPFLERAGTHFPRHAPSQQIRCRHPGVATSESARRTLTFEAPAWTLIDID
jgi:GNAT superfamily N-acetyltransferase